LEIKAFAPRLYEQDGYFCAPSIYRTVSIPSLTVGPQ
jgi:hypothetical protein